MISAARSLLAALTLVAGGAGAAVVAAPPADVPIAAETIGAHEITLVRLANAGDTVQFRLTWPRVADARGAADAYQFIATDSAKGTAYVLGAAATSGATTAVLKIPVASYDETVVARVAFTASRRGKQSPALVFYLRARLADAPPPAPGGVQVDTLTGGDPAPDPIGGGAEAITLVGAPPPADCTPSAGRLLTAGTYTGTRGDTAYFVRALPELPTATYCVDRRLVVLAEGDLVVAGGPAWSSSDSITTHVFPRGAVLPFTPPTPASSASRLARG